MVEAGHLELHLPETGLKTPAELAKELEAALQSVYDIPWKVVAINENINSRPVAETFVETKARKQKEAVAAAADHPTVRKALDTFAGAEVVAVQIEE